jgi:hypothetical protein
VIEMDWGRSGWDADEPFEIKDYDEVIEEYRKNIHAAMEQRISEKNARSNNNP